MCVRMFVMQESEDAGEGREEGDEAEEASDEDGIYAFLLSHLLIICHFEMRLLKRLE